MTIKTAPLLTPGETVPTVPSAAPRWLAAVGLVSGLGAVVASSCCAISLGLAALGAGAGILGAVEWLGPWRIPLLVISAFAIVAGWAMWWRKRPVVCRAGSVCISPRRSRATLALLVCASAAAVAALSWNHIDPLLFKMFVR